MTASGMERSTSSLQNLGTRYVRRPLRRAFASIRPSAPCPWRSGAARPGPRCAAGAQAGQPSIEEPPDAGFVEPLPGLLTPAATATSPRWDPLPHDGRLRDARGVGQRPGSQRRAGVQVEGEGCGPGARSAAPPRDLPSMPGPRSARATRSSPADAVEKKRGHPTVPAALVRRRDRHGGLDTARGLPIDSRRVGAALADGLGSSRHDRLGFLTSGDPSMVRPTPCPGTRQGRRRPPHHCWRSGPHGQPTGGERKEGP
jgi:hypothetical protein